DVLDATDGREAGRRARQQVHPDRRGRDERRVVERVAIVAAVDGDRALQARRAGGADDDVVVAFAGADGQRGRGRRPRHVDRVVVAGRGESHRLQTVVLDPARAGPLHAAGVERVDLAGVARVVADVQDVGAGRGDRAQGVAVDAQVAADVRQR